MLSQTSHSWASAGKSCAFRVLSGPKISQKCSKFQVLFPRVRFTTVIERTKLNLSRGKEFSPRPGKKCLRPNKVQAALQNMTTPSVSFWTEHAHLPSQLYPTRKIPCFSTKVKNKLETTESESKQTNYKSSVEAICWLLHIFAKAYKVFLGGVSQLRLQRKLKTENVFMRNQSFSINLGNRKYEKAFCVALLFLYKGKCNYLAKLSLCIVLCVNEHIRAEFILRTSQCNKKHKLIHVCQIDILISLLSALFWLGWRKGCHQTCVSGPDSDLHTVPHVEHGPKISGPDNNDVGWS